MSVTEMDVTNNTDISYGKSYRYNGDFNWNKILQSSFSESSKGEILPHENHCVQREVIQDWMKKPEKFDK